MQMALGNDSRSEPLAALMRFIANCPRPGTPLRDYIDLKALRAYTSADK